jgi:hypothetical protein
LAVLAASLLSSATGYAADLGGDCCADLEERVAELEAVTVRKSGKVTLTLSGYLTKQVMSWDDGVERNTYVADIGPTQATNYRLGGQATIAPGWTAGYLIRVQDLSDNTMKLNQYIDNDRQGLNVQMVNWFVASKEYGKLTVGKQALASKSAAMFTDLSGTQLIANYVLFDGGGFFMRQHGELLSLKWGDIGYCYSQARPWGGDCDGIVMEGVRYDSPTFAGFSWSTSFGQDDDWEAAGRYTGEMGGFKIALGVGYSTNTDDNTQAKVSFGKNSDFFQAGGYVEHLATGLFLHADYGAENNNNTVILSGLTEPDSQQWYAKGGIRGKWTSLGTTILYGEYGEYLDQIGPAALNTGVNSSTFTRWGLGVAQELDKAAMTLWLKYREHDGQILGGTFAGDLDAFRYVSAGGLIYF